MNNKKVIIGLVFSLFAVLGFVHSMLVSAQPADLTQEKATVQPQWECWNNGTTDPCLHNVHAIDMFSSNSGWAVGDYGSAMKWNGNQWQEYNVDQSYLLNDVNVLAENDVWAVGIDFSVGPTSKIYHWNGSQWSDMPSSINVATEIDILSSSNGWVGGWGGVEHFDGNSWTKVLSDSVTALDMLNENYGWTFGYASATSSTVFWQWDGNNFNEVSSPWPSGGTPPINKIEILTDDNVWAVGNNGYIWHYDGNQWSYEKVGYTHLTEISILSTNDIWVGGSAGIYHWDGTDWEYVLSSSVSALDMVSANDGWSSHTMFGRLMHWNGATWGAKPDPISGANAVDLIAYDDAWAVGNYGSILYWDSSAWSSVSGPTSDHLYDIDMLSSSDGWAVGGNGTIIHWNGSLWSQVASPITSTLRSISMLSPNEGWAIAGGYVGPHSSELAEILKWDGNSWQVVKTLNSYNYLYDIDAVSTNDVWAGGSKLYHWDGNQWTEMNRPTQNTIADIEMISTNDGWIAAYNEIARWDGIDWKITTYPPVDPGFGFTKIHMNSSSQGWATGFKGVIAFWDGNDWSMEASPSSSFLSDIAVATSGEGLIVGSDVMMKREQGQWSRMTKPTAPFLTTTYADIKMVSESAGWAVGGSGSPAAIIRWQDDRWQQEYAPFNGALNAVDAISTTNAWAVGEQGTLLFWDGLVWQQYDQSLVPDVNLRLLGVSMVSSDQVWAVGNSYNVLPKDSLWFWNGTSWITQTNPVSEGLNDVDMLSATDGWIVGDSGTVLRWNGSIWQTIPITSTRDILKIDMTDSDDGWATDLTDLYHWDGVEWLSVPNPADQIHSLGMLSSTDGWATVSIGSEKKFMRWDGVSWTAVDNPSGKTMFAVDPISANEAWAVGQGVIMHYSLPPVLDNHIYLPAILKP